jgi:type IV secretion system protein TrbI
MATVVLAPAAGRRWLTIGLSALVMLIGAGLVYRQVTGNTMSEQRAASAKDKASKELAGKTPGSAEAFSARLESKRKDAEEAASRDDEVRAKLRSDGKADPATPPPALAALDKLRGGGGSSASGTGRNAMPPGIPGQGGQDTSELTGAQLDAYEALKAERAAERTADVSRRMGAWESSARPGELLGAGAGMGAGGAGLGTPATSGAGTSAAALLEAYQRSQAANAPAPALGRDASFLKQAGEKAVLPPCRAQVSRNVYDSVTGQDLVISAGSQVICTYNAEVVQGQERLLLAFTRLIYPSGASVQLGPMQGADAMGAIGAPAEVNSRFWKIFGSTFLVAAVTKFAQTTQNSAVTVNVGGAGSAAGGVAANVLAEVARASLQRNMNIKPELRINAGDRLSLIVSRDMVLDPTVTGAGR